jgi:Zn-dependent protease with chaperone function
MMKKIKKSLVAFAMFALVISMAFAISTPVLALDSDNLLWGEQRENIDEKIGLGNEDPRVIAASIINVILGFLGIIAVVIIMLGGFKWMTAGGNEDKIGEAKGLLSAGIIGLVIILASWGLATWIVDLLYQKTSGM